MRRRTRRRTAGWPRRPCSPGAAGGLASLPSPAFLLRRFGDEVLALVRRQRLVLGPFLAQLLPLLGPGLDDAFVVLARNPPLLGGELRPGLHAALHPLLLLHLHAGIALGDADPVAPALGCEGFPVGFEGRKYLLLLGGELGPRRTILAFRGGGLGRRRLGRGL